MINNGLEFKMTFEDSDSCEEAKKFFKKKLEGKFDTIYRQKNVLRMRIDRKNSNSEFLEDTFDAKTRQFNKNFEKKIDKMFGLVADDEDFPYYGLNEVHVWGYMDITF